MSAETLLRRWGPGGKRSRDTPPTPPPPSAPTFWGCKGERKRVFTLSAFGNHPTRPPRSADCNPKAACSGSGVPFPAMFLLVKRPDRVLLVLLKAGGALRSGDAVTLPCQSPPQTALEHVQSRICWRVFIRARQNSQAQSLEISSPSKIGGVYSGHCRFSPY